MRGYRADSESEEDQVIRPLLSFIFRLFERGGDLVDDKPVYVHYGHDEFHLPDPIRNSNWRNKPIGGLWASRKDDPYGWKSWCEREEFRLHTFDQSFEFTLKDYANILVLSNRDQLDNLPKIDSHGIPELTYNKEDWKSECYLDFKKLKQDYDAIELTDVGQFYWALYGWDCNSILIMNPDIVEVI